ncbi:DUF4956 domain-containing protein [Deinococcus sp. MIMF12]|uniref:DUF4956 domain-containing protein n=1 Tax=Deinococcus rhizophilus TaxID=3049544 RepID=A0ABT7JHA9_9DEIO|nr:DUF4956 domain-containing protein [Deinococcus rhizophilus]MDL2344442.1 DUF4956 domain-containing protein [Deinococcus rhizophilus]
MLGLEGLRPDVFLLNLAFVLLVSRGLYSRTQQNPNLLFSLLMFGVTIFLVVSVFSGAEISLGFGFGLFAVFGILRYRTGAITTRDLTYLFVVVAMAMINGLSDAPLPALLLVNVVVLLTLLLAQSSLFAAPLAAVQVDYERVDLAPLARRAELLHDLRERTGLDIQHVQVMSINYVLDTVRLRVIHRPARDLRTYSDEL